MVKAGPAVFDSGCDLNSEALNIHPPFSDNAFIPDLALDGSDADLDEIVAEHPQAIFEVVSPGRETYDRITKFEEYRRLPALRHYVRIAQKTMRVEHLFRKGDSSDWRKEVLTSPEDRLIFSEVPFELSLAEIYERVLPLNPNHSIQTAFFPAPILYRNTVTVPTRLRPSACTT